MYTWKALKSSEELHTDFPSQAAGQQNLSEGTEQQRIPADPLHLHPHLQNNIYMLIYLQESRYTFLLIKCRNHNICTKYNLHKCLFPPPPPPIASLPLRGRKLKDEESPFFKVFFKLLGNESHYTKKGGWGRKDCRRNQEECGDD